MVHLQHNPLPANLAALQEFFEIVPDDHILDELEPYRRRGRPGIPQDKLWRAYLAQHSLGLRTTNDLIRALQGEIPGLAQLCGFEPDAIPSRRVFNRFALRMADHTSLIMTSVSLITGRFRDYLPGFGEQIVIDSTILPSYSAYKRAKGPFTDPDARLVIAGHPKGITLDGKRQVFGYKLHLMADANYQVPLILGLTNGADGDSLGLIELCQQAKANYGWFRPNALIADRAYDSAATDQYLAVENITPIILQRRRGRWAKPTLAYLDGEFIRLHGKRWTVEELFHTLNQHRGLTDHFIRGFDLVLAHCLMTMLAYQTHTLIKVKEGRITEVCWGLTQI